MIKKYFDIFYGNCGDSVMLINSTDLTIVDANNEAFSLYEVPIELKSDVLGKPFKSFKLSKFSFLEESEFQEIYSTIKEKGKWSIVLPTKTITNKPFLAETSITIINFEGEKYFVVRTQNISDSIVTKREIAEIEKGFISVMNKLPNGIIIHKNGEILYVNPYLLNTLHHTENQLIGKNLRDLVDSSFEKTIINHIEYTKKNKLSNIEQIKFNKENDLISFSIQSIEDTYHDEKVVISILNNLEIQKSLAKESIRAKLAEDANILLEKEISKHKETQKELMRVQELKNSMINSSLDMIIASDNHNIITHISPSAAYTFGYTEEELKNISTEDLYHNKDEFEDVVNELNEKGFFIGEVKNVTKNGEVFLSYLSASLVKNEKGELLGTMGISRDIREIKNIEQEIIRSERKYRELFENLNDAVIVVDENNCILDINQAGVDLLEIEHNENVLLTEFYAPECVKYVDNKREELIKNGVVKDIEIEIVTKSGNRKIVDISSNAIYEGVQYKGSRDIIRDITQKKYNDKLIQEQSSKIESIFNNSSNVLIWTLDQNFNVSSANKEFVRSFSQRLGSGIEDNKEFFDLIDNHIKKGHREVVRKLYSEAQNGISQEFESILYDKSGNKIWYDTFLSPIIINGKKKFDIACLAVDITNRKEAEQKIISSLEEKEVLLKEVHHRVKNNLQVISSILNLQSSYVKDENTLSILRESQNRIKSMSFIHESLYRTKDFSSVDFSGYVENLVKNIMHSYIIEHGDVQLELDLGNYRLNLDQAIPCGLIINELISNAMKYAFPNKISGVIKVIISEMDNILAFEVSDNGVGLPKNLDIENTDSLGLQLVHTLIDQLEGNIEVINYEGTKYLFNFTKIN